MISGCLNDAMEPVVFSSMKNLASLLRWITTEETSFMYSLLNAWEASGVKLDIDSSSNLQEARCVIDASKPGIVSKHPIRRILNNTRYDLRRFISFAMTAKLELDIPYYNDIHHQIPDLYTQHHGHSTSIHDANDVETKAAFPAFCHSKSLTACSALEKILISLPEAVARRPKIFTGNVLNAGNFDFFAESPWKGSAQ